MSHCQFHTSGLNRDGTLKHDYPANEWRLVPLGHWKWNWNQARTNYSTYDQEPLAGMLVLSSQPRLLGTNPIVWLSDQESVKTFQKDPPPEKAKLKGWWTYLSQFRLTVHHIPGIKNEMADYISRNNFDALLGESSEALAKEAFQRMDIQVDLSMRTAGVLESWSLRDYQAEYQCVLNTLRDGLEARLIDGDRWYKDNRYLYYEDRIVVPEALLDGCLQWADLSSGHTGCNRSVDLFMERFCSLLTLAELRARMQSIVDSSDCHASTEGDSRDRGLVSSLPIPYCANSLLYVEREREREARVMGGAGRAAKGRTEGTGRPQGGEAQAVEELQRAWADHRRRQERVERAEREAGRQVEGRGQEDTPLVPFRQPAIPPEHEGEMQESAWRRIRAEAGKLAERNREVAAREHRVREEEEAVARGSHRVLPDPEGDTPSTDVEGRSPSGKGARDEEEEAGQERGKRRRGEERGAGEAERAPRPASPSPEPTPTDWDFESPPPRQYAPPPVRRGPGTVAGWTAGEVAELVRYVKWAGKTRGRRENRGTRLFSDLVGRAGRPRERGPEMDEGWWRRMLGEALPGVSLDCPQEKGKKPRVRMLRELLQREWWYGGNA